MHHPTDRTAHTTAFVTPVVEHWLEREEEEKERIVLFNDALNTFYLRLYGVRHMVKGEERKNERKKKEKLRKRCYTKHVSFSFPIFHFPHIVVILVRICKYDKVDYGRRGLLQQIVLPSLPARNVTCLQTFGVTCH